MPLFVVNTELIKSVLRLFCFVCDGEFSIFPAGCGRYLRTQERARWDSEEQERLGTIAGAATG